jgi:integrase/recombinase XerC
MPSFRNGLAKVGRVYYMKFKYKGQTIHESTGCEHKVAAEQVLKRKREDLALQAAGILAARDTPTLKDALSSWCAAQEGVMVPAHIGNVRSAIQLHLKNLLTMRLDEITTPVVESARADYLRSKGRGYRPGQKNEWELAHTPGGANKLVQHLSSVIGWSISQGWIEARPFNVKPLKPQERAKAVVWPEQVGAFLKAADEGRHEHSGTAIRLMIGLGLREEEALGAKWEWLDQRRRVYIVGASKSRKLREIPLPDWLFEHLISIWEVEGKPLFGFILLAADGKPHRKGYTEKPVDRCAEELGIVGLHPHRLRATFATAHYEAGTPLSQIQQMLGHRDPETTLRYILQRPHDQAEAQRKVAMAMRL